MKRSIRIIAAVCGILPCLVSVGCGEAVSTYASADMGSTVNTEQTEITETRVPTQELSATTKHTEPAPTEAPTEPEPAPEQTPTPDDPAGAELFEWNLILVNPWNKIPDGFTVELKNMGYGHYIDRRAYDDWQAMFDAAYGAGYAPVVCSSYRTHETQTYLYWNKVEEYRGYGYEESEAQRLAGGWVAVPDTSEHQLGLALDIVDSNYRGLDRAQEDTAAQKWLMENSYKYGFILRYSSDKSDITGINYEPWHYRYVGKEAAKEIYEQGVCLEEYLESKQG